MEVRWYDENSIEYVIASAYAAGKGKLFEIFGGWRETNNHKCKMVFTHKDWTKIDTEIEYYNTFIKG